VRGAVGRKVWRKLGGCAGRTHGLLLWLWTFLHQLLEGRHEALISSTESFERMYLPENLIDLSALSSAGVLKVFGIE